MNMVPEDAGLQELSVTATLEGGSKRIVDTQVMLSVSNLTTSDSDYSALPAVLTIDSGQPQGTATMLLVPADDSIDEDDETLEVRGATAELALPVTAQQVIITDDDSAGVSIDPTELIVIEGDATGASYAVVLDSQPTGDVTVTVSGHDGTDVSVTPSTLTFTSGNWETPQTVTVNAAQDEDAAPDQAVTLAHAVGSVEDTIYNGIDPESVTVTIEEDDAARVSIDPTELTVPEGGDNSYTVVLDTQPSADVTVTISGHSGSDLNLSAETLTFTPDNWNVAQTVTVTAGQDDDAAADPAVTLSHAVSGASEYAAVSAGDIPSVTVTIDEDDAAGVSINPTALTVVEGSTASYTVVLDTQPSADVTVAVTGHAGTDLSLSGQTLTNDELTFTSANWNQPQTVTITAGQDDDAAADPAVTLSHAVSGAVDYAAVSAEDIPGVTVTIEEDDAAAVSIDPTELTVTEGDATGASYAVVLDSQPTADVTIDISGHADTDVSVTPSTLTFTSESWGTAQTVTVSAAQDDDAAPDEAVTVSHTVSGAEEYQAVTAESVTVTIEEDDAAAVSIDPNELTVTEGDATGASYTVVLDSQPTADVTVTISGHAGTDVTLDNTSLTFTPVNWNVAQTVTVSAAQDDDAAADPAATLSHAVSGASRVRRRLCRGHPQRHRHHR